MPIARANRAGPSRAEHDANGTEPLTHRMVENTPNFSFAIVGSLQEQASVWEQRNTALVRTALEESKKWIRQEFEI